MNETILDKARQALAEFEARMGSTEARRNLCKGLDLLDELCAAGGRQAEMARNVGDAYVQKIEAFVSRQVKQGGATEPEAEHLFRLLLELESYEFGGQDRRSLLKISVLKLLVAHYFLGYSDEERNREVKRLLGNADI